ncbi:MAG: cysteine desulfurase [Pirellulales bacterium]|nr:cysteine desulfurase [Pirellulales bacterium]
MDPRVADVIDRVLRSGPANASSQHALGQRARNQIEQSLEVIGKCLGSPLDQPGGPRLILTSGGTESNNLALLGIGNQDLLVSRIEHPSVIAVARWLEKTGRQVHWIDAKPSGEVDLGSLDRLLDRHHATVSLVSIMSANNETGVLQPIREAAEICAAAGVPLHVDATQSIGKVTVNLTSLGAAAVTFAAHKFHGPQGIGALWVDAGVKIQPVFHGGQQQLETRPGTEPLALIVGMAEAVRLAVEELETNVSSLKPLRDRLETTLCELHPDLVVHGLGSPRLPTTSCISFVGADRQSMLMALDLAGIASSSGSACSSGSSPPSHVLQAMNVPDDQVESALRFGVSKFSTMDEIETAIRSISSVYKKLRQQ